MARSLPYGEGDLPVPDRPFRLEPLPAPPVHASPRGGAATLAEALSHPVGGVSLREAIGPARRVLIAVSDATRCTGIDALLPELLGGIEAAGAREVAFIVGSGLHRRPDAGDVRAILGPAASGYPVVLHDPDDAAGLVELGRTRAGTPVRVNRAVREHERIVLTGAVGFHYYAGFTGGRKAVVPGVAGRETIARNHLRALRADGSRHPRATAGRLDGNPVHRDMTEGAALVGPHFLVNTVLGDGARIERVFAGHWRRAHLAACRHVRATRTVRVPRRSVVVVSAGGWPHDIDLIQSHKAFEAAFAALAPGGTLVLVAECRRGAGHDDFLDALRLGGEAAMVAALRREFRVYGQTALAWHRKAARCRLVLVSSLGAAVPGLLGAEAAADLGEALALAARYHPRDAEGWLVPWGARYRIEPVDGPGG